MFFKHLTHLTAAGIVVAMLISPTISYAKRKALPEVDNHGLHLVHDSKLKAVYLKPGAEFSGYKRVKILDSYVAFRKHWRRDHNETNPLSVSSSDMDKIKKLVAEEFHKVFVKELEKGGYSVVDETGDDVLLLRPAIINLDVEAPDTMSAGMNRTFAASAGSMTLYLELYDSAASDLIATVVDPEVARDYGRFMAQNRVTNLQAADEILKKWADTLRDYLDHAHKTAGGGAAGP